MGAWRRWQDWATVLLGVILAATPFIFNATSNVNASWTAYVIGGLLILSGLYAASMEEPAAIVEAIPLVLGVGLFAAPWLLAFTSVPEVAWASWIVGVLTVVNAAAEMIVLPQTHAVA